MPNNTDPFADVGRSAAPAAAQDDPFASLGSGFDAATGAPGEPEAAPVKPSFGARAKEFVHEAPRTVGELAPIVAANFVPGGGIAVAGGTALKAAANQWTIGQLQDIMDTIPDVNVRAKTAEYYQKLQTLRSKGWSDAQIMDEARKRAENVARGAQATRESLDQDVSQIQATNAVGLPAEAVTNAVFFGAGNRVLGALGSGLGKMGISVAAKPASSVLGRVAQSVVRHSVAGAAIGAVGMGAGGATENALMAWAQDKPLNEIGTELVKGAKEGGSRGAIGGAVLGGVLGPVAEPVVEGIRARALARVQAETDAALAKARDLALQTAKQITERDAALSQTVANFNPHDAKVPAGSDPVEVATTIIQQAHGEDAALSEAGMRAASQIADKIKLYHDANEVLEGNVNLPGQPYGPSTLPTAPGVQSIGAPLEAAPGGQAPENLPTAVQGPIGQAENQPVTAAPAAPPEGLEGNVPGQQVQTPLSVEGNAPAEGTPAAARLARPLGPIENSAGVEQPANPDPNLRDLAPANTALPNQEGSAPPAPTGMGPQEGPPAQPKLPPPGGPGQPAPVEPETPKPPVEETPKPKAKKRPGKKVTTNEAQGDLFAPPVEEKAASGAKKTPEPKPASTPEVPAPKAESAAEVPAPEAAPVAGVEHDPFSDLSNVPVSSPEQKPIVEQTPEEANATAAKPPEGAPRTAPAHEAAAKLAGETHADVQPTANGKGIHIQIGVKPGEVAKPGGPATALDNIVRVADEHGVRVETDLVPAVPPNGKGRIPLEKLIPWYEARGFKVTESTRIPEGNLATAKLVREPIGEHQNAVASALEKVADGARKRIAKRGIRLNAAGDLENLPDMALELAADAFSRRLRDRDAMASWAVQKWGDVVKPFIDKLIDRAQKHFVRMFKDTGNAEANLDELMALHESGAYGMGWYEKTAAWAKEKFGSDADMFLRFLAVTSANGQTESGAAMALKAYAQWRMDMPFVGFRGKSMTGQLQRVARGENLGDFTKIQNFLDALRGNPDAVVLDRWMIDAMGLKEKGGALRENDYRIYSQVVKDLARENGMTPRQFQAAVWEGARVRALHTKWEKGGPAAAAKTGSARPLEDLIDRKLAGMTPEEYAKESQGHLKMMQNLYQALQPVRTGIIKGETGNWEALPDAPSGHTFDPETFAPAAHEGHVVSLVSNSTAREHLYPSRLLRFRANVEPLIKELEAKGLKPTIGVWQENAGEGPTGRFSLDLNVMMKDRGQALELGRMARNFEIAKLGKGGEWQENIPTGYDPEVNGKQFLPPKDFLKRDAWHKQQINRARAWVAKTQKIAPSSIITRMQSEAGRLGDVGVNPKHSVGNVIKAMQKHGARLLNQTDLTKQHGYGSMTGYYISPEGDVLKVRGTHAQLSKAVRKAVNLPSVRGYDEGAAHGAGSDVQALLNEGWIRAQASGSMIAFDLSRGITDEQRSLLQRAMKTHEDWAAAISNDKGALVDGFSSHQGDKAHHFLAKATEHNGSTE